MQHCRIHWRQDAGIPRFYLTDNLVFDSLYDLITHYQEMPLRYNKFEVRLMEPEPWSNSSKDWYHANLASTQAEPVLIAGATGRHKRDESSSCAIYFRAGWKIQHCHMLQESHI